jgi:hypothetical protein
MLFYTSNHPLAFIPLYECFESVHVFSHTCQLAGFSMGYQFFLIGVFRGQAFLNTTND